MFSIRKYEVYFPVKLGAYLPDYPNDKEITLITLYDKSEQASITKREILSILKEEGLI